MNSKDQLVACIFVFFFVCSCRSTDQAAHPKCQGVAQTIVKQTGTHTRTHRCTHIQCEQVRARVRVVLIALCIVCLIDEMQTKMCRNGTKQMQRWQMQHSNKQP